MAKSLFFIGGAERDRTAGLIRARDALSQLSYCPILFSLCKIPLFRFFDSHSP